MAFWDRVKDRDAERDRWNDRDLDYDRPSHYTGRGFSSGRTSRGPYDDYYNRGSHRGAVGGGDFDRGGHGFGSDYGPSPGTYETGRRHDSGRFGGGRREE